ncbi:SanA/YdcF family protein [Vaginella massiliensis]|uniref:SanA/YdcF family protein n=1 Tax=Vaginella massiliensis TaxID=1816680 RepID=UPI000839923E|nr:ElyC/SanA/YdcF family protein [Vaginella massiliensis]
MILTLGKVFASEPMMQKINDYIRFFTDTKLSYFFKAITFTLLFLLVINGGVKLCSRNYIVHQSIALHEDAKVAVVFGARFERDGNPSVMLKDRLDSAIDLYTSGKVEYLLLAGESLRPNLTEVDVMEKYCVEQGVPVEKIIIDGAALDTYSTVYRVKHIYRIKKPIFITQDFHMNRALFIGRMMNLDCIGYTADLQPYRREHHDRMREMVSNVKAILDVSLNRIPPYVIKERSSIDL